MLRMIRNGGNRFANGQGKKRFFLERKRETLNEMTNNTRKLQLIKYNKVECEITRHHKKRK